MKQITHTIRAYGSTMSMCAKQVFDGGPICIIGEYIVQFLQFFILILVWKALAATGVDLGGMSLEQLFTYTLMASVLKQQLNIVSPATSALWEGSIIGRYTRPMPVVASFVVETIGRRWIPVFIFFGLPLWILAPTMGINTLPADAEAGFLSSISLVLSISLGFAMDLIFAAVAIHLKNGCWAIVRIRDSVFALLSGAVIPFALFPGGIGTVFTYLPFGSIASAPLTIYTGLASNPLWLIGVQCFWNIFLWMVGIAFFKKSEEEMISYGG